MITRPTNETISERKGLLVYSNFSRSLTPQERNFTSTQWCWDSPRVVFSKTILRRIWRLHAVYLSSMGDPGKAIKERFRSLLWNTVYMMAFASFSLLASLGASTNYLYLEGNLRSIALLA